MAAKFVAEDGALKGLVLSLEEGDQWVIGRDPDACQLLVEDPLASRKHLICKRIPEGILVENLSTTNPIEVNSEPVTGTKILQHGDSVKIGSGNFRFYAEAEAKLYEVPENNHKTQINTTTTKFKGDGHLANLIAHDDVEEFEEFEEEEEQKKHNTIFDEEDDGKEGLAEVNFDIPETGRWLLKVVGGPNKGAEFSMQGGNSYVIGTDPNTADIIFHDTSVSRQHSRISVSEEGDLTIEDLNSRNGTLVDGEPLTGKIPLKPNIFVSIGTSSFVVFDREGEMQTIISPLLPSIVKVLQKEEPKAEEAEGKEPQPVAAIAEPPPPPKKNTGNFVLISIITGLFLLAGAGTVTLFKGEPIEQTTNVDAQKEIANLLDNHYPSLRWNFNKNTGRLLLIGHVLTSAEKMQLMASLQEMNSFIKNVDESSVVIDELTTREFNSLLAQHWRGISLQNTKAGHFVLVGYLKTRSEAERLSEYMTANFPYLELLEKRIIVDEDVIAAINSTFQKVGIKGITATINNGQITLTGSVPSTKVEDFNTALEEVKAIPGVRPPLRNFVTQAAPEASLVNISDKYSVTGYSIIGKGNVSVMINGRIVTAGDNLDGMTIKSIKPNQIMLEKDGVQYRIDYSR